MKVRSKVGPALALVAAALVACSGSGEKFKPVDLFPVGAGIQQDLSLAALTAAGWRVCYEDSYGQAGAGIATLLAGCTGNYLMLACRPSVTSDTLTLAAADAKSVVTQVDAEGTDTFHAASGVGWYFTDTQSWGFFPAGEPVVRLECDGATTLPAKRLCWHALAGKLAGGYRCGATVDLGADLTWRRVVLTR
ncbi:MAG TPA: hypothetical protein VFP50_11230 [Anaeromyxobacteraceae bacterium]|nr:hypothetical protein [Anaeromyxobacteraceae bacterium]